MAKVLALRMRVPRNKNKNDSTFYFSGDPYSPE